MNFTKKVLYSSIISGVVLITSMVVPIIPCNVSASVPNSIPQWSFCNTNPDAATSITYIKKYLGYVTSMRNTYFLILLITFLVAMIFFHYTIKNKQD